MLSISLNRSPLAQPTMKILPDWNPCCPTPLPLIAPLTLSTWICSPRVSKSLLIWPNLSTLLWTKLLLANNSQAIRIRRRKRNRRKASKAIRSSISTNGETNRTDLIINILIQDDIISPNTLLRSRRLINKHSQKYIRALKKRYLGSEKTCVRHP